MVLGYQLVQIHNKDGRVDYSLANAKFARPVR